MVLSWQSLHGLLFGPPDHRYNGTNLCGTPKTSQGLWLAIRQRLGTQDWLPNISNPSCLLCGTQMDNHDHLFFACPISWKIWNDILAKCNTCWQPLSWSDAIHHMAFKWKNSFTNILRKLAPNVSVYTIWAEQNDRFHTNSWRNTESIIRQIKDTIRCRITSLRRVKDCPTNRILQSTWAIPDSIFT